MEHVWMPFLLAAVIGAAASALAQAGTQRPSRVVDLIGALVAGFFFGTFALFLSRWVLVGEAMLGVLWVLWAQVQQHRPRTKQPV